MAETINDVVLTNTAYKNLNTETSISSGQRMIVLNKSSGPVRLQIKITQPSINSSHGWIMIPQESAVVFPQGTESVWALGSGPIYVQVYY